MAIQAHYKRNVLILILFMFAILVAGAWLNPLQSIDTDKDAVLMEQMRSHFKVFTKKEVEQTLPSIKVLNLSGESVNLAQNNGQFTVLNIWATWCAPCIKELPSLQKLSRKLNDDWRVIAVSIDIKSDEIEAFTTKTNAAEIASYHDTNMALQNAMRIIQLPVTYILDDQNTILYEITGDAVWDDKIVVRFLKSLSARN